MSNCLAIALALVLATSGAAVPRAVAADYPSKPIRIVVPFPPGSGADVRARKIAEPLAKRLGKPVVIDNRPGAGGNIGAGIVARASPDGHTLLTANSSVLATNPHLQPPDGFDTLTAFAPIIQTVNTPMVFVVPASLPVHSVQDFVNSAKRESEGLRYGSSGSGSLQHLAIEQFARLAGLHLTHIPYKGETEVLAGLMGDQVSLGCLSATIAPAQIKAGKLRALAVSTSRRVVSLPDTPTLAETGFPGYELQFFGGFVAPAKTPKPIIERLNREIAMLMRDPEIKAWTEASGAEVVAGSPDEFAALIKRDYERFGKLIRELGLKPE